MVLPKIALKDYSTQEVINIIKDMDEPLYRGEQVLDWIYKKKVLNIEVMTNLPLRLRERLKEEVEVSMLAVKDKLVSSKDNTVKYLFETLDNELLECAVMKQEYGNTVCVSSQVGCGLGCVFCASTRGGLVRNLTPGEMLEQVIMAEKYLECGDRIKNIVVMGMGEPLYNLENLLKFLKTANDSRGLGIGWRNITISTAGIAPKIVEFAREKLPVTLAVSLHAPEDELRTSLMPINRKYPLKKLLDSCKIYIEKVGRRITFEYVLLKGINDTPETAEKLAHLLTDILCHVNLIPANPVGEEGITKPGKKRVREFREMLEANNIPVSIRKERGEDIEGACGQLRRRAYNGKQA